MKFISLLLLILVLTSCVIEVKPQAASQIYLCFAVCNSSGTKLLPPGGNCRYAQDCTLAFDQGTINSRCGSQGAQIYQIVYTGDVSNCNNFDALQKYVLSGKKRSPISDELDTSSCGCGDLMDTTFDILDEVLGTNSFNEDNVCGFLLKALQSKLSLSSKCKSLPNLAKSFCKDALGALEDKIEQATFIPFCNFFVDILKRVAGVDLQSFYKKAKDARKSLYVNAAKAVCGTTLCPEATGKSCIKQSGQSNGLILVMEKINCASSSSGGFKCIASHHKALLEDGTSKALSQLVRGDKVLTDDGFSEYIGNIHRSIGSAEVLTLNLADGNFVQLTEEHLITTQRGFVMAKDVRQGDVLKTHFGNKDSRVISFHYGNFSEVSAPLTKRGTISADGIIFSCFSSCDHDFANMMFFPYRIAPLVDLNTYAQTLVDIYHIIPKSAADILPVYSSNIPKVIN